MNINSSIEIETLVNRIVGRLFVNGFDNQASRLRMVNESNTDLGGWSRDGAACQVRDAIHEHVRTTTPRRKARKTAKKAAKK